MVLGETSFNKIWQTTCMRLWAHLKSVQGVFVIDVPNGLQDFAIHFKQLVN